MTPIRFDAPVLLWLAAIAVPLIFIGWRAMSGMDATRRITALALRTLVVLGLAVALAQPRSVQEHDQLTVVGVLDVSGSVKRFATPPDPAASDPALSASSTIDYLRTWFRSATESRRADDRVGLIVFDGEAAAISVPTRGEYNDDNLDLATIDGTDIAAGVDMALALMPGDTAKRVVLMTDGNETRGDAAALARRAAGAADTATNPAVPIDVLPIEYRVERDAQLVRVESPPSARPGQVVTVRMVFEATQPVTGRITLTREDVAVDLNGGAPGVSRPVTLPAGQSVQLAQVKLGEERVNRFEAFFEPDDPQADAIIDNNMATAFTATPGKGSILIVTSRDNQSADTLAGLLAEADLPVKVNEAALFPEDLLRLQSHDLVILNNVAAYELTREQHELLRQYVEDLGGGLIMIGGENSFGAGGWNNTAVEAVLPVEMDPPKELRVPTAALVLVLDKSGSMNQPVAGARATKQEVANRGAALAIESLRSESLVAVVAFDYGSHTVVPLQRNDDPKELARLTRGIRADGGTAFGPGLRTALQMLNSVDVDRKRVVLLSDGQAEDSGIEFIVDEMAEQNIKLTTIAVGDDADATLLAELADRGDGEFFEVRDPRSLPRVLIDAAQVLNKPLIKEVPFTPRVLPTGSTLTAGMDSAPELRGLVITSLKDDPRLALEMTHDDPSAEPLLAHWQIGLGRAAAFTSDVGGEWSRNWQGWDQARAFWLQLVRMMTRPPQARDAELFVQARGDELRMTLEATGDDGFMDYIVAEATVYQPDGTARPVRLRQTAPGRYEATTRANQAGNYIVAVTPRRGERRLAPTVGGASRATSPEFRRYASNTNLLNEIARATGGRTLDALNPQAVNLFDRADLPRSVSLMPMWPLLLLVLLAVFLLDVACRRIAWNVAMLQSTALRAVALVTPGRVKGERAQRTLSELRRKEREVEQRMAKESSGVKKLQGTGRVQPRRFVKFSERKTKSAAEAPGDASNAEGAVPKRPTPKRTQAALDMLSGRGQTPPQDDAKAGDDAQSPAPDKKDDPSPSPDTTSGLLAAKRRARRRMGE